MARRPANCLLCSSSPDGSACPKTESGAPGCRFTSSARSCSSSRASGRTKEESNSKRTSSSRQQATGKMARRTVFGSTGAKKAGSSSNGGWEAALPPCEERTGRSGSAELAPINGLQLCLRGRTANSIHGQVLIALKLFHRRTQNLRIPGLPHCPGPVTQVIQSRLLPAYCIDGIQMADFERHFDIVPRKPAILGGGLDLFR